MLTSTLARVRCPIAPCGSPLEIAPASRGSEKAPSEEITTGTLHCAGCGNEYPIVGGVAVLVPESADYLLAHAKGVAKFVRSEELPKKIRREFARELRAQSAGDEHIEEDLESERVVALYLLTHYYRAGAAAGKNADADPWWKPLGDSDAGSPLIDALLRAHWDSGPFHEIERLLADAKDASIVELGCGVGGLVRSLPIDSTYLGIDTSFASIARARQLNLAGAPSDGGPAKPRVLRVPGDLLGGALGREVVPPPALPASTRGRVDYVVGGLEDAPAPARAFDVAIALNAIDMLDDPSSLPKSQSRLLRPGGRAIQSSPYVWHPAVADNLRRALGAESEKPGRSDSASAVERLYERAGFTIESSRKHLPWLFFKHLRQIEVYSVHLLSARLGTADAASRIPIKH